MSASSSSSTTISSGSTTSNVDERKEELVASEASRSDSRSERDTDPAHLPRADLDPAPTPKGPFSLHYPSHYLFSYLYYLCICDSSCLMSRTSPRMSNFLPTLGSPWACRFHSHHPVHWFPFTFRSKSIYEIKLFNILLTTPFFHDEFSKSRISSLLSNSQSIFKLSKRFRLNLFNRNIII